MFAWGRGGSSSGGEFQNFAPSNLYSNLFDFRAYFVVLMLSSTAIIGQQVYSGFTIDRMLSSGFFCQGMFSLNLNAFQTANLPKACLGFVSLAIHFHFASMYPVKVSE